MPDVTISLGGSMERANNMIPGWPKTPGEFFGFFLFREYLLEGVIGQDRACPKGRY
jgi:hypothetical protein